MARELWQVREEEVARYAVARERLLKAVRDGLQGQVREEELQQAHLEEAVAWTALARAIDDVLDSE